MSVITNVYTALKAKSVTTTSGKTPTVYGLNELPEVPPTGSSNRQGNCDVVIFSGSSFSPYTVGVLPEAVVTDFASSAL